jgi:hypothetical protein
MEGLVFKVVTVDLVVCTRIVGVVKQSKFYFHHN